LCKVDNTLGRCPLSSGETYTEKGADGWK